MCAVYTCLKTTLKIKANLSAAGDALPFADITLNADIEGQSQIFAGFDSQTQLADAGIAIQRRRIDGIATGGDLGLAVELVLPGSADIGADQIVDRVIETPAQTQTVGIDGIEAHRVAGI